MSIWVFSFLYPTDFLGKTFSMIIWYYHQIVSSFHQIVFFTSLMPLCFQNWIVHQLEKVFFHNHFLLLFVKISIHISDFIHVFWLNLITLSTLFNTSLWFKACFKFVMWITYSVLSHKLATSFSTFSVFIFSGKNGWLFWVLC